MEKITFDDIDRVNKTLLTTDIKGKDYIQVNQRIKAFRMLYPNGAITTELLQNENGICVFKATIIDENGKVLATGTAYEKENNSFINKTSYIENCVPLDTQILTKSGWKFYHQIQVGDEVLSFNMKTLKNEYCKVKAINIYKNKPIINLYNTRFNVSCTNEHKWIVRSQHTELQKIETKNLTNTYKIVQAVKQNVQSSIIGKKLGWLMCDCTINKNKNGLPTTAYINQSKYVKEIENLFGAGKKRKKYEENLKDNFEWVISAEEVRKILGYFKISSYKDLAQSMLNAKLEDVQGCYQSMMLADGETRKFSSTYRELIDAMQIMCIRLGIATTFVTKRMCKLSTKPIYSIGIKTTDGVWVSELKRKNLPPQDVWCPTTENGTWFMKQGNFVSLTSNCETSAVGRALGMVGFGIDTSVASAEEVGNAITQQESNESNEVIDARMADALDRAIANNNINETAVLSVLMKYGYKSTSEIQKRNYMAIVNELKGEK